MSPEEMLESFYARSPSDLREQSDPALMLEVFRDLDSLLSFTEMSEEDRSYLFRFMEGLTWTFDSPEKSDRANFFDAIQSAIEALEEIVPSDGKWRPLNRYDLDDILTVKEKLEVIHEAKRTWTRYHEPAFNLLQRYAVFELDRLFRESQSRRKRPWNDTRINAHGIFVSVSKSPDQTFKPNPAKMIVNMAIALGAGSRFTEASVDHAISLEKKHRALKQ